MQRPHTSNNLAEKSQRDRGTSGSGKPKGRQREGVEDMEARRLGSHFDFHGHFCLHKKMFKIRFYNCVGIKMNIIQADDIHFISSDI